ncbi:class I SAM-dependent methyltransferase [Marisediminicola senii]|uniref:class I SAM-dependent methyltransferase n=1 Tax=Marisediminicola senii TaxID=2711233 RepID=UPI0013EB7955|nr:class I SAM-dependent methyltransferase [Marisediminicola senii]
METAELLEVLSADGLRLLDSLPPYDPAEDTLLVVSDLRKAGNSAAHVAAVLGQRKLRAKAVGKFGSFAARMLFTEAGLQQATRLSVAAVHAGRFRAADIARVADLGCGIGADALAYAALDMTVIAVERDEVTAAIAAYNLAPWHPVTVVHADATTVPLDDVDGVFLDPARRTAGHENTSRLTSPDDWSPSLDFAFGLGERMPAGIKLAPGIDRDLIPPTAEAQWVSVDREVVEVGVWFGPLARPGITRSALVMGDHGTAELTAAADSDDVPVRALGSFVYEPDGAVIRARLIGDLARRIDAGMLSTGIAYLTSDAVVETPFARAFRVLETFPLDEKLLKRELAARGIGTLEIKKRGVDLDPAQLRKRLSLSGQHSATLIATRVDGRHAALLVERV